MSRFYDCFINILNFLVILDSLAKLVRKRVLTQSHKTLVQISIKSGRLMEAIREGRLRKCVTTADSWSDALETVEGVIENPCQLYLEATLE